MKYNGYINMSAKTKQKQTNKQTKKKGKNPHLHQLYIASNAQTE